MKNNFFYNKRKFQMNNVFRIEYCCKNIDKKKIFQQNDDEQEFVTISGNNWELTNCTSQSKYVKDLLGYVHALKLEKKYPKIKFKIYPHDRVELFEDIPTLVKSRLIVPDPKFSILLNLNKERHFQDIENVKKYDIPFDHKKNVLIWRGATTGYGFENELPYRPVSRQVLVERYCFHPNERIDVGYSNLVQGAKRKPKYYEQFRKDFIKTKDMLHYKYILSVEGNDVATNLKWLLYSNSLIFMPKPFMESWILESQLIPYYHYIPVANDFSDLQIQLKWCDEHQEQCKTIIKNANRYIQLFLNEKNEMEVIGKILEKYIENVIIE